MSVAACHNKLAAQAREDAPVGPGRRVLVAMSGGVDSSLAAVVLRDAGCELVGVNMRTHRITPEEKALGARIRTCCSPVDARDARACAEATGFPFYVLDVEPAFERDVIAPFIDAYASGRTPNPCVLCNNHVKLGALLDKARVYGCEYVATGHYARKERHPSTGRWALRRAADTNKDQCYYLAGLTQEQLALILFPLGGMTKPEVREAAAQAGLVTAAKPESQEICFVPDNDHRAFLRRRFAARGTAMPRGRLLTTRGEDLGEHEGVAFYTIGQRRGLGIAAGEALYVVDIDADRNNVILGRREECLFTGLLARGMNWMAIEGLRAERRALVQVRHRHAAAPARLLPGEDPAEARVVFDQPVAAVAPGQAVVFWDEQGFVLGGGWIERGERSSPAFPADTAPQAG